MTPQEFRRQLRTLHSTAEMYALDLDVPLEERRWWLKAAANLEMAVATVPADPMTVRV